MAWEAVLTARAWAIVPVKRLALAKQRLASMLGPHRESFARLLAQRTVNVLAATEVFERVLVMTPDPCVASDAIDAGASVVDDDGCELNEACRRGLREAATHGVECCAIVHADIATLSRQSIEDALLHYAKLPRSPSPIGFVRCKKGTGTNVVVLDPRLPFKPSFGVDSFAEHMRLAAERGFELPGGDLAFDVDTIDDLERLAEAVWCWRGLPSSYEQASMV